MPLEPTYLGTVEDVRGASISVALAKETAAGLNFISGVAYRIEKTKGQVFYRFLDKRSVPLSSFTCVYLAEGVSL